MPHPRWSARVLTGVVQPRTRGEHKVFLLPAFKPGDVFDFNNSDDAALGDFSLQSSGMAPCFVD